MSSSSTGCYYDHAKNLLDAFDSLNLLKGMQVYDKDCLPMLLLKSCLSNEQF
jgi:hypothetical protein